MRSALIVALFELRSVVRSKAFFVGVLLVPALLAAAAMFQTFGQQQARAQTFRIGILDATGVLERTVAQEAARRSHAEATSSRYELEWLKPVRPITDGTTTETITKAGAERVRKGELSALLEIPNTALMPTSVAPLRYYSLNPSQTETRQWISACVNEAIRIERLAAASIDREKLQAIETPVSLAIFRIGPYESEIREFDSSDQARALLVPLGLMVLLFLTSLSVSGRLLTGVLEEKTGRIAEVFLGAIRPFDWMLGKLLGTVALSTLVAGIYLTIGIVALATQGAAHLFASWLVVAFFGLLLLQVLSLGALFLMIGAACNDIRDTQSLSMPMLLVATSPAMLWPAIVENPTGMVAHLGSVVPLASPAVMMLRLGLSPTPSWAEIALSICLSLVVAVASVAAAARVFRVGLLRQGQSAGFLQLMRWVLGSASQIANRSVSLRNH